MPGHRGVALVLLAFAVASAAGCASAPSGSPSGSPSPSSSPSSSAADPTGPPAGPERPPEEEVGPAPEEEGDGPEEPVAGPSTVSVEFAGLPVGGGAATLVDDGWCQVLYWGGELPDGVVLRIERVVVGPGGGTVVDLGCMDAPACAGRTISSEQPEQGCAVLVRPPAPDAAEVRVRLDGVLECPDVVTCETLASTSGGFTSIASPVVPGGDPSVPDDADEHPDDVDGSDVGPDQDAEPDPTESPALIPGDG